VNAAALTTLRGILFGGDCGVASADYSIDRGQNWRQTQLENDEGKYGFRPWQTQFTLPAPDKYNPATRAHYCCRHNQYGRAELPPHRP
jgi:hypothetical protein